jgi:hypothetical protein
MSQVGVWLGFHLLEPWRLGLGSGRQNGYIHTAGRATIPLIVGQLPT